MFLLKTSLRTIPISQCRRQLSITSVEKNRGSTTLEEIKFARAKVGDFVQSEPQHENPFTSDGFLQSYLARLLPREAEHFIRSDLQIFGDRCASEIQALGRECEDNPPYLVQTSAWGERRDEIVTCPAWKRMKSISAEEGLIAIAYERKLDVYSRLYQMVKLFMFSPVSGLYSCPLAMTDGAAKTIQSLRLPLSEAYNNLVSRDPGKFWTSGQWMTERRGGSDVGAATETVAIQEQGNMFRLYGYKWFSSATDSDMSMSLARVGGGDKLSMFYLKTRDEAGRLNNIQVVKMKNKLGTRQLPTAELLLDGTEARLVAEEGRGIASISSMLTITRLHNTLSAVSAMRKILSLARDYGTRRVAFGNFISKRPLHVQTMARMEVEVRGCTALFLDLAAKLGREDAGLIEEEDLLLLRLLTPVAKMYTAKSAMAVVSEGLECFGGQGYIEDTGIPGILRDAQVLPIWEGTSTVMSLDVLRAINKSRGAALSALQLRIEKIAQEAESQGLSEAASLVVNSVKELLGLVKRHSDSMEAVSRDLCVSIAHIYIAAMLLEHAAATRKDSDRHVLSAWLASRPLITVSRDPNAYTGVTTQLEENLVYENFSRDSTFKSSYIR